MEKQEELENISKAVGSLGKDLDVEEKLALSFYIISKMEEYQPRGLSTEEAEAFIGNFGSVTIGLIALMMGLSLEEAEAAYIY